MHGSMSHALLSVVVLSICLFIAPAQSKIVVCYYANWAQYRPAPGAYVVGNIEPFGCTHMIFAFAQLSGTSVVAYEANDDRPPWMWRQFTELKNKNPKLKCLLALGGYTHGSSRFSTLAANPTSRSAFIRVVIQLLRYWNFDGLDLDWEYPGDESPLDKDNLSLLVKELREAFEREAISSIRERLLLAAATPAGIARLIKGYNITELNKYLDFFNIMTYDYHGQWEMYTGLASPLYAPAGDQLSVVSTVNYYLQQGASKSKINLGLGLYGRSWTLSKSGDVDIGSPAIAGGAPGTYTRETGVLTYYEVCNLLRDGYTERFDPVGQVNYAFSGNQWITYENERTIAIKLDYIVENDFGGAMVWSLDLDDFSGLFCGRSSYPLLTLISSRLINTNATGTASTPVPSSSTVVTSTTANAITTASTATPTAAITTTVPSTAAAAATTSTINPATTAGVVSTTLGSKGQAFKCPEMYGMHPDSNSCSRYYVCRLTLPIIVTCGEAKLYDPVKKQCSSTYACPY